MKTTPSSYILVAELCIIFLFHAVKIRQAEKIPAHIEFTKLDQPVPPAKPFTDQVKKPEYMFVNFVK